MCVGENCAPQAVHYMNAQLAALYDNARACLDDHHVTEKKLEETRYSHALAEYKYFDGHKDEPKFSASFDKPWVEFICNHDVILHLKIRKGHYRLDYHKAPITYSKKDIVQPLEEVELSFRVRFDIQGLRGKDAKISSQDNLIQLVILNLTKAQLIASEPAIIIGRDAFVHYMEHYLCFLHQAGNHVLFSLPDFDDDKYRLTIDFSLMKSHVPDVHELHGISIDKINEYLLSVWLKAAMLMDGAHGKVHDWKQTCLAEYRSIWSHHGDGDNHFRVRLGAPRIKAICSREVVLYFTIEEVHFYDSADFEKEPCHSYSNWEIAVLVDVIYEKTHDGHVTTCKLDLSTARSYHSQCNFGDIVASDETVLSYCTCMLTFFTEAYLDILESIELHVIYRFDARWLSSAPADDGSEDEDEPAHGEWEAVPKPGTARGGWASTVTQSEMYGFDQITAISQPSVNAHFRALWEVRHSVLATWKFEHYFQAEFEPVTIRLLSHERAIVSIRIQHGFLKPLKGGKLHADHAERHFDNWHLVFEVGIKRTKHSELNVSDGWRQKFKESLIFKEHGHHKNRQLEHIHLDFQHAEFLYDFSTFEGLFNKGKYTHGAIDNVLAARHYVEKQYLPHLVHSGLHIIHTVPVWTSGPAESLPSCALTSFTFHVYSKTEITRHSWAHGALEPVIIVLGMTKYRELPSMHLEYSANWDIRVTKGVSHGTVCVSRSAFMETRLLRLLEQVNSLTTVVPKFYGVHDGDWEP
ncbi:predicted protein [Postia placenta Mad-698-R]|nr:predicted protein [Postia placenta Mad-698-R]